MWAAYLSSRCSSITFRSIVITVGTGSFSQVSWFYRSYLFINSCDTWRFWEIPETRDSRTRRRAQFSDCVHFSGGGSLYRIPTTVWVKNLMSYSQVPISTLLYFAYRYYSGTVLSATISSWNHSLFCNNGSMFFFPPAPFQFRAWNKTH